MTQTCHPISQPLAHDMLRGLVEMICDRPGQTKAQRDARATEVVHSVLAFQPRDPVEMMFASMVVTHFHLISHSAHEVFAGRPEDPRPRAGSGIVALDRAMVGFVKELHTAKKRPLEGAAEAATTATPEAKPAPKPAEEAPCVEAPVQRQQPAANWGDAAPAPLLPPLRSSGASITAMMAVLSPPTKPIPGAGVGKRPGGVTLGPALAGQREPVGGFSGSSRGLETFPTAVTKILPGPPGGGALVGTS